MSNELPNGPYHYYLPNKTEPVLCEIEGKRVWFIGDDAYTPIAMCTGRFVPLTEVRPPQAPVTIGESVANVASGIGMAMLKRTLDEGGTISIPSLGITIGPPQTLVMGVRDES